jgi:hypothetical protein
MRKIVFLCYLQLLKQYLAASIILTRDIKDTVANYSCTNPVDPSNPPEQCTDGGLMKLDKVYSSLFTTKVPEDYALSAGAFDSSVGGTDIALYTTPNGTNTYAYITAGEDGWRVVDVTDPTKSGDTLLVFKKKKEELDSRLRGMTSTIFRRQEKKGMSKERLPRHPRDAS